MKKIGLLSWVLEFAGRKRKYFAGSVILAICGVANGNKLYVNGVAVN